MGLVLVPVFFISIAIYIWLLWLAWNKPESRGGKIMALAVVLSPLVWQALDVSVGYIRFKMICNAESGFKVYAKNLPSAKRVRLMDDLNYPETLLDQYPSIQQVEAEDKLYFYVRPTAYALYERGTDGKIASVTMDRVGSTGSGTKVLEAAPSQADYFIEATKNEKLPYRLSKTHYTLRDKKQIVAETISFGYTTANPDRAIGWTGFGCGPLSRESFYELHTLLSLIATKH